MKFAWALLALLVAVAPAFAQEPNIDALLSKLPKAESFQRPKADRAEAGDDPDQDRQQGKRGEPDRHRIRSWGRLGTAGARLPVGCLHVV